MVRDVLAKPGEVALSLSRQELDQVIFACEGLMVTTQALEKIFRLRTQVTEQEAQLIGTYVELVSELRPVIDRLREGEVMSHKLAKQRRAEGRDRKTLTHQRQLRELVVPKSSFAVVPAHRVVQYLAVREQLDDYLLGDDGLLKILPAAAYLSVLDSIVEQLQATTGESSAGGARDGAGSALSAANLQVIR